MPEPASTQPGKDRQAHDPVTSPSRQSVTLEAGSGITQILKEKEQKSIWTGRNLVWIAVLLFLLNAVLSLFLYQKSGDIQQAQREGRERSFQTRAVVCRFQLALGIDLRPECLEEGVTKYYDLDEEFDAVVIRVGQR